MLDSNIINSASQYFNANWDKYRKSVDGNALYHKEMFETLNQFLITHFNNKSFSIIDMGCGDSLSIANVLVDKPIKNYIGIDAAEDILHLANDSLLKIPCEKQFICDDMSTAIGKLKSQVDVIFTSYAVHHLSYEKKVKFIEDCQKMLKPNGFFIMLDGILNEKQNRDDWLNALSTRIKMANPHITDDELEERMAHPRSDDFPENISAFEDIAKLQNWKNFNVLTKKEIFAFMVFEK